MSPSDRTQAMLYLANDLVQHKQYYGSRTKAAIKHVLNEFLSASEIEAVAARYNATSSSAEQFENIPSIGTLNRAN